MNIDLTKIRKINWAETNHWEVQFSVGDVYRGDFVDDFKLSDWFPATDVKEDLHSIQTKPINLGVATLEIPLSLGVRSIRITFVESEKLAIHSWLRRWCEAMFPNRQYVTPLNNVWLKLDIIKYLSDNKTQLSRKTYKVFPKGDLVFSGSSTAAIMNGTIDFSIINLTGEFLNNENSA